jgi:Uncharacterized protein conserved in cyanobacteria
MMQGTGAAFQTNAEFVFQLSLWNHQENAGVVLDSSTGFRLPNAAIRSPDAAWISQARWQALTPVQRRGFIPLCPDFLMELCSPTDDRKELQAKMHEYLTSAIKRILTGLWITSIGTQASMALWRRMSHLRPLRTCGSWFLTPGVARRAQHADAIALYAGFDSPHSEAILYNIILSDIQVIMRTKKQVSSSSPSKSITATEAARHFSEVINQVRYRSIEFDIVRGKEVVARIVPPTAPAGVPLARLNELFRSLPRLNEADADAFLRDVQTALSHVVADRVAWD